MDGASVAGSNGGTGEGEHVLYFLGVFFFAKAEQTVFPEAKAPAQGSRSPSLSGVNFEAYEQILKC